MAIERMILLAALVLTFSCGDVARDAPKATDTAIVTADDSLPAVERPLVADSVIRHFLVSKPGTYGWQTTADDVSLDFFPDGRLHIQGPDGEATMWQGSWSVKEGVLGMDRKDLGVEESFRVVIVGDSLKLGERVYSRYRP